MNIPDNEKKRKLENIIEQENKNANLKILKDGVLWWKSPSTRNKHNYYIEEPFLDKNNIICDDNGVEYTILYSYPNEVKWYFGLLRSFTYSILPDYVDMLFSDDKKQLTNSWFWEHNNFKRSLPLYIILILISITFLLLALFRQIKNDKIMRGILAIKTLDNLESELNSNISNELQSMSVDLTEKFIWDNQEMKRTINVILHDLKYIAKLPEVSFWGNKQVAEVINTIQYNLKNSYKLEELFPKDSDNAQDKINNYINNIKGFFENSVITYKELLQGKNTRITINDLYDIVDKIFKKMEQKKKQDSAVPNVNFEFILSPQTKEVEINQARLENILGNLIKNSSNQISKYDRTIRKNPELYKEFEGCITIKLEENIFRKGQEWICLSVSDNGGGFAKNILKTIYKVPVKSSKIEEGMDRVGEGTQYIKIYTEGMHGDIEARNQKIGNFTWAITKIYLPIIKE